MNFDSPCCGVHVGKATAFPAHEKHSIAKKIDIFFILTLSFVFNRFHI